MLHNFFLAYACGALVTPHPVIASGHSLRYYLGNNYFLGAFPDAKLTSTALRTRCEVFQKEDPVQSKIYHLKTPYSHNRKEKVCRWCKVLPGI